RRQVFLRALQRARRHCDAGIARANEEFHRVRGEPWRAPAGLAPVAKASVLALPTEQHTDTGLELDAVAFLERKGVAEGALECDARDECAASARHLLGAIIRIDA